MNLADASMLTPFFFFSFLSLFILIPLSQCIGNRTCYDDGIMIAQLKA